MKRFLLLLFTCQLMAMQNYKMHRTFSMNPRIDSLKSALMGDDTEVMEECLKQCLPQALDRQYELVGLQTSKEARNLLLKTIQEYWYAMISKKAYSGLETLLANVKSLSLSYELNQLDHSFKLMLTRLKRAILQLPQIRQYQRLFEMAQSIPSYGSFPRLTMTAAHVVGQEAVDEVLPQDCVDLIDRAKPSIAVALPRIP